MRYPICCSNAVRLSQRTMKLTLIRHGTALKNTSGVHGGAGTPLTASGRSEARLAALSLKEARIPIYRVLCAPREQCLESGSIVASVFAVPCTADALLMPLDMGVVDGLSDAAVTKQYPDVSKRLQAWRRGEIEVSELELPHSEPMLEFARRGHQVLEAIRHHGSSTAIVATRSVLVLLTNLLLGHAPVRGGGYREVPWPAAGAVVFHVTMASSTVESATFEHSKFFAPVINKQNTFA
jgi:broad specificity phosphatase PhoE